MKQILKKTAVILLAVICALSIQISVAAEGSILDLLPDPIRDFIQQMQSTNPDPNNSTTAPDPNNGSTAPDPNNGSTVSDPVNNQGTGTLPSTTEPVTNNYYPNYQPPGNEQPNVVITTEPTTIIPEEDSSSLSSSLQSMLERDSANSMIVGTPTEPFTIGNIVQPGDDNDGFTWQSAALIAALVLFVVLLALIVALLIQRGRKVNDDRDDSSSEGRSSEHEEPVKVEIMTPERIAELLGASANKSRSGFDMSSDESAAAIKAAALMGQLTGSYSDPLIRKYTDEPVMISPVAKINLDADNVTGAQILEATDSMLVDFDDTVSESKKQTKTVLSVDEIGAALDESGTTVKVCPECGRSVSSDDVFCHNCGTYVG